MSEDTSHILECMFSIQPQPAAPMCPYTHLTWGYQPHVNFSNPVLPTAYIFSFQNGYQATYSIQNNSYPGKPPAFCSALSDATYNTINTTTVTNSAQTVPQESTKTHPRAQLHQSNTIWDLMPVLRTHTHCPHPRLWECPPINQLFKALAQRLSISTHRLICHSTQLLLTQTVVLYRTYFIFLSTAWSYLQMTNNFSSPKLR